MKWEEHQEPLLKRPIWRIEARECVIVLQARPDYCDRGNWQALLFPTPGSPLARDLDDADAWPRYYFDLERAKLEVEAWLKKRGQGEVEKATVTVCVHSIDPSPVLGRYDRIADLALMTTDAQLAAVFILGGAAGNGFSISNRPEPQARALLKNLPENFRRLAKLIEGTSNRG